MDKQIKKYLSAVKRRLNLPKEIRNRLLSDLQTTITARLEQGESWETVSAALGSPAQVAESYMEQMKDYAYRKSPWRFAFLTVAIVYAVRILREWFTYFVALMMVLSMNHSNQASIGIIGGADGPTAIFLTSPYATRTEPWLISGVIVLSLLVYFRLRKCKQK